MHTPEFQAEPSATGSRAGADALAHQYENLRKLFLWAVAAFFLLSLAFNLFIAKQMRLVRAQVQEQRPLVEKAVSDFQQTSERLVRNFTGSMHAFAASHPDFQPILEKYRPILGPYMVAPATPAPATAPPANPSPAEPK